MANSASVVTREYDDTTGIKKITWAWTSDDAAGSVTCESVNVKGRVQRAVTNPGTTAPTADYDIVINDEDGVDVMQAQLGNRHTSNSEQAWPLIGTIPVEVLVLGDLTPVITNAGNSKIGTLVLYIDTWPSR